MKNNTKEHQLPENLETVFWVGDRESSLTVSKEQLIELIKLAEKTGSLPKLPTEWWEKVSKQS